MSTMSPIPIWSSATMNSPFSTSLTMFWAPKPRPAPRAAVSRVSEPTRSGASALVISTMPTMPTVTFTMFCRMVPSVRVRCTSRMSDSGERSSACVSSTLAFDFALSTMRCTTRRITKRRANAIATQITMISRTFSRFPPASMSQASVRDQKSTSHDGS